MNKRIIDGMTAEQIQGGWNDVTQDLLEYLEDLCKPEPSWEDDVSKDNPVLCWVGFILKDIELRLEVGFIRKINSLNTKPYECTMGGEWNHARPISPNECWKPTKQGDTK